METCFVMQPFDGDVFDKRYETVFAPAIKAANLEPYRVDRDPGVSVPIEQIEAGIQRAGLCFAEITMDNPNVWFELGYAIAASREVVLVCADERKTHFPFDVQHRSIIKYKTGAPQDFDELKNKITERIVALIKKQVEIGKVASISPMQDTEGLSSHEVVALVTVMQNNFVSTDLVSSWRIRDDMNKAGFTDIAVALAMKHLSEKNLVYSRDLEDDKGYPFVGYGVTTPGEKWLMANQGNLRLREDPPEHDPLPF